MTTPAKAYTAAAVGKDSRAGVLRAVPDPEVGAGESAEPSTDTTEDAGPGHASPADGEPGEVAIATAPVPDRGCE